MLNTNKWMAMQKSQSGRKDQAGNDFKWWRDMNSLDGDGHLVQTVGKEWLGRKHYIMSVSYTHLTLPTKA